MKNVVVNTVIAWKVQHARAKFLLRSAAAGFPHRHPPAAAPTAASTAHHRAAVVVFLGLVARAHHKNRMKSNS
jgi:hypothetical protein